MANFGYGAQFGICAVYVLRNLDNPDKLFYPMTLAAIALLGSYLHNNFENNP